MKKIVGTITRGLLPNDFENKCQFLVLFHMGLKFLVNMGEVGGS